MEQDKAGENYWQNVWENYTEIPKININYYTSNLLHNLFSKYLKKDSTKTLCEIGGAMSQNLLYFKDYFGYEVTAFDYEAESAKKTEEIYKSMGYNIKVDYRDFFDDSEYKKFDILTSFGVFEHFDNLDKSIKHTLFYLKNNGTIITVIPNMNGIVGFLQKLLNKKVYDVHIPYTREDLLKAHEKSGYKTLFCDYYGIYQAGVINISGIKNEKLIQKFLAIPGKPLYYISKLFSLNLDSKFNSPYIIYIGKKI